MNLTSPSGPDPVRVFYCGTLGAGRTTSLLSIVGELPKRRSAYNQLVHMVPLEVGSRQVVVRAFVSKWRQKLADYDLTQPSRPQIAEELAELRRSQGVMFVVDSRAAMSDLTVFQFSKLKRDLSALGRDVAEVPIVVQANRRDDPSAVSMAWMRLHLAAPHCAYAESIAVRGVGTRESLIKLVEMILPPETA